MSKIVVLCPIVLEESAYMKFIADNLSHMNPAAMPEVKNFPASPEEKIAKRGKSRNGPASENQINLLDRFCEQNRTSIEELLRKAGLPLDHQITNAEANGWIQELKNRGF